MRKPICVFLFCTYNRVFVGSDLCFAFLIGVPLDDEDRKDWLDELSKLMSKRVADGTGAVIACSSLKVAYRNVLRALHGAGDRKDVTFVYLKGSFELFDERIRKRTGHYMPSSLLQSQFDTLQEPTEGEAHEDGVPRGHVIVVDASKDVETICKETAEIISHF